MIAFTPTGNTVALSVSVVSANAFLPGIDGNIVRVFNNASAVAFVKLGTAPPTAILNTDMFVAPGSTEAFSVPPNTQYVAAILASGIGTVYCQRGEGN